MGASACPSVRLVQQLLFFATTPHRYGWNLTCVVSDPFTVRRAPLLCVVPPDLLCVRRAFAGVGQRACLLAMDERQTGFRKLASHTPLLVPAHTETFGRWMDLFSARVDAYVADNVRRVENAFVHGTPL